MPHRNYGALRGVIGTLPTVGDCMDRRVRRLPVIDEGHLVGAITRFDILRVIRANLRPE